LNRTLLHQLTEERVRDAQALLAGAQWSGAYYLAGYAVECALKSCVLAHVDRTGVIFQDRRYAERCWTHDLVELVKLADLEPRLGLAVSGNADLQQNWSIAQGWSESSRYELRTRAEAQALFDAVTDPSNGILPWIKMHW
jgi:hypothetical protein